MRNGQLHFQVRGDGPHAILCIPGALGTALIDFLPQLEYFGRKGSVFTIVGMDPLEIDALDGYTLMKSLWFAVLGWSDGGASTTILAAPYPELVQSLVIWGSNAYVMKYDIELFEKTRDVSH